MKRQIRAIGISLLLAFSVVAGGCSSEPSTDEPSEAGNAATEAQARSELLQNTFDAAREVCRSSGLKQVAREFDADPSDPNAVAQAFAEGTSTGEHIQAGADGCREGLSETER